LRKEDLNRVRRTVDASAGLIFANGEVVFHILYCIIAFTLYKVENSTVTHTGKKFEATKCNLALRNNPKKKKIESVDDRYAKQFGTYVVYHGLCAVLLTIAKIFELIYPGAFFQSFAIVWTIPMYQYAV
jgi:hypothetical protein